MSVSIKKSVIIAVLFCIAFTLSAVATEISLYTTGDVIRNDEYHYGYIGGEIRTSWFETVKPFVSVGFSGGSRTDANPVEETTTATSSNSASDSTFSTSRSTKRRLWQKLDSYLATVKGGVEYRAQCMNGYQCGIGIFGVVRDHIRDAKDEENNNVVEQKLSYGFGAEISAIVPLLRTTSDIESSCNTCITFKVYAAYDFQKTINVGAAVGGIFKF